MDNLNLFTKRWKKELSWLIKLNKKTYPAQKASILKLFGKILDNIADKISTIAHEQAEYGICW